MDPHNSQNFISEVGSDALGEAVGAGIGLAVAGPAGAIAGAAAGSIVSSMVSALSEEFLSRLMTTRECKRVKTVVEMTIDTIEENLRQGKLPREDGFLDRNPEGESIAEEIYEGVFRAAEQEYENRKLLYLAKLNANIAFDESITRPIANRLLKIATSLTFHQIVIIHLLGLIQIEEARGSTLIAGYRRKQMAYAEVSGTTSVATASDIYNLYQLSLISSSDAILDAAGINPATLRLSGYGAHLFNLIGMHEMDYDDDEAKDILSFLMEKTEAYTDSDGDA